MSVPRCVGGVVFRCRMKSHERTCKFGRIDTAEQDAAFLGSAIIQEEAVAWSLDETSRYQSIGYLLVGINCDVLIST